MLVGIEGNLIDFQAARVIFVIELPQQQCTLLAFGQSSAYARIVLEALKADQPDLLSVEIEAVLPELRLSEAEAQSELVSARRGYQQIVSRGFSSVHGSTDAVMGSR